MFLKWPPIASTTTPALARNSATTSSSSSVFLVLPPRVVFSRAPVYAAMASSSPLRPSFSQTPGACAATSRPSPTTQSQCWRTPLVRSVIQSLLTEARRSPDLAAELTERFINPRREAGAQMLRRAVDRGEVRPDSDLELALDLRRSPLPARRDPRRRVPAWLLRATHRRGAARTRRQVAL